MKPTMTLNDEPLIENPIWADAEDHMRKFRSDIGSQIINESKAASEFFDRVWEGAYEDGATK